MSKTTQAIAALGVVAGLGVAALPLSSYASTDTENVTAEVQVEESISVSTNVSTSGKTVEIKNVTANQDVATGKTQVKIETNNNKGYNVAIEDADSVTALTTDGADVTNGIPALGDTTNGAAASLTQGAGKAWGYKVENASTGVSLNSGATSYRGIEESPNYIASRAAGSVSASGGDTFDLVFGVIVDTGVQPGTYSDTVTITATTKS